MKWKNAIDMLTLADFIEQDVLPREEEIGSEKFNMHTWFDNGDYNSNTPQVPSLESEGCGTSACAMGWAAALWPQRLEIFNYTIFDSRVDEDGFQRHGTGAAASFFDITPGEASDLFSSERACERSGPEQVDYMRQFVAKKWEMGDALK